MLSQIRKFGQIRKPIKLRCQGSKLRFIVSGTKFAASEVKRMQLCREYGRIIRMKFDKINAQNYVKFSEKVLKKCLKVCSKANHLPDLNDGRVRNRDKNCVFLE